MPTHPRHRAADARGASSSRLASHHPPIIILLGLALGLALTACADEGVPAGPDASAASRLTAVQAPASSGSADDVIPDEYIVVLRDSVRDVPARAKALVAAHGGTLRHTYTSAIQGFAAHLPPQAIEALAHNPMIASIETDRVMRASGVQSPAPSWGLDRIDQRSSTLDYNYTYPNTGAGVSVYILDSGIRSTHVEFGGRAAGVFTSINDGLGTSDCTGHGTHAAGTIGSSAYGVAKGVKLYGLRVLGCDGSGSSSGVIAAVDWVTQNRVLPAVANMSLGGSTSSTLAQAVQNSIASGVVYAVAAGNASIDACSIVPANVTAAITVGASNQYGTAESYSNYGKCVDLYAPGRSIISTWFTSDAAYAGMSGTSMASPHVAGAAALYLSANPTASPAQVTSALVGNATAGVLSTVGSGSPNLLLYTGFIGGASSEPPPPSPTPAPPDTTVPDTTVSPVPAPADDAPVASFTANCRKGACTFNASSSSDDVGIGSYDWDFGAGSGGASGASLVTVSYAYGSPGNYLVTLTVVDVAGRSSSSQRTVNVRRLGK